MLSGTRETMKSVPKNATTVPTPPASDPYKSPSVKNAPAKRDVPAPHAMRIAISFSREKALARSTKAMLEHAINRIRPTAPDSKASAGRACATTDAHQKDRRKERFLSLS